MDQWLLMRGLLLAMGCRVLGGFVFYRVISGWCITLLGPKALRVARRVEPLMGGCSRVRYTDKKEGKGIITLISAYINAPIFDGKEK